MITLLATATILSCGEGIGLINKINKHSLYTEVDKQSLIYVIQENMPQKCREVENER